MDNIGTNILYIFYIDANRHLCYNKGGGVDISYRPQEGGKAVAVSKAQQKAVTKYVKNKYDRFGLTMPKGTLDTIKAHAEARGESVNGFVNRAIAETMERDK